MEKTNNKNNINFNKATIRAYFREGCINVFKKWSAFRLALDNNPQVLTYYNEDQSILEINEYLEMLYDDILNSIYNDKTNNKECIQDEIADCLYTFIGDYFNAELDDQSDIEISKILYKLFLELKDGKIEYLEKLKKDKNKIKYNIEFPITGNQKIIMEKYEEEKEEDEEEEENENNNENVKEDIKENIEKNDKENNLNNKNNKKDNKMEIDDEGFIIVKKKGKKC
jgi:hypothetical protein